MSSSNNGNVDLTTLFPDFRVNKPLRFLRLFQSKISPKVWRNVKTKCEKIKHKDETDCTFSVNHIKNSDSELIAYDETQIFLGQSSIDFSKSKQENEYCSNNQAHWRMGPAKLWYDMLGVSESGKDFDYGFKIKDDKNKYNDNKIKENPYPDDAYLMVSQLCWENDIIWNGEDKKNEGLQKPNNNIKSAGWILNQPEKGLFPLAGGSVSLVTNSPFIYSKQQVSDLIHSIFPVENKELVYGTWEDEIIWDAENMEKKYYPKILTLDPSDENIILSLPNDQNLAIQMQNNVALTKSKRSRRCGNKSKLMNDKAGVIDVNRKDILLSPSKFSNRVEWKDPFNISNDFYYQSKASDNFLKYSNMQHSTPVLELRTPFIPTYMGPWCLRNFHRPPMERYTYGTVAQPTFHTIHLLTENIKKKAKFREKERIASGGSHVFFMKTQDDLTGRDGTIILVEYCEEYPPLLSQVGMCSKIKNYYKCVPGKDADPPILRFGETAFAHNELFLGILSPGQTIQVIENNLYRAPIYEHKPLETDFLLIRTRHAYYVREIDALFTAGQLCPLYQVPGPNTKNAKLFVTDFLRVFIYRLFWKSNDSPKRIRMEDVKTAFPQYSEIRFRNILRQLAVFKRTEPDTNWWILKPDFYLPPENEIRTIISPEDCCAYFSFLAAEQRLLDAGYGDKFIMASLERDNDEMQLKMNDEIKIAPWNTTRAYIEALKKKCILQLTGPADPTGCGEGFSYVRISNKPNLNKEHTPLPIKRVEKNDDLRRLSLLDAKNVLMKFSISTEEIKKMSRWKIIDAVRKLCTEKAMANKKEFTKYSRNRRYTTTDSKQERYKEECQRIFDLQNQVLSSNELLSTDDEEGLDEDNCSDIEKMGKNIEKIFTNTKTSTELSKEKEEQERLELCKMLRKHNNNIKKKYKNKKYNDDCARFTSSIQSRRVLKIYRTYRESGGKEFTKVETVSNPDVIDAYIKIKTNEFENCTGYMDQNEIKCTNHSIQKQQSRYMKQNLEQEHSELQPEFREKDCVSFNVNPDMFTNHEHLEEDNLVNFDGTIHTFSNKLLKHIEDMKKRFLILKNHNNFYSEKKRKNEFDCQYFKKLKQSTDELRDGLLTVLSTFFESILIEICTLPDVYPFIYPVDIKKIPDYYNIVQDPMDLQTIMAKVHLKKYLNREQMLCDLNQIVVNSTLYNGEKSSLTTVAHMMLRVCVNRMEQNEKEIMYLEKAI